MPANGGSPNFDLPEHVHAVLPSDPYELLDVARKITSIALATRVSKLESEISKLNLKIREKEEIAEELLATVENLESSLAEASEKLARAEEEKENLLNQNASLSDTVKKLNRDVAKLEIFRKTLMQSLQEEEDGSQSGGIHVAARNTPEISFSSQQSLGEEAASLPPSKLSSVRYQNSDTGSSFVEDGSSFEVDAPRHGVSHGFLLASHSNTPRLTPPDSPTRSSATVSPKRLSKPVSPRRHSISVSTSRNMFDDRSSAFSSVSSSHHSSMSSPFDTGRGRVDGKEFFRQVRSRLSYEQFSAFLANVKELNSHKQTREETLKKADEIFGPDNKDLYAIFEGLISRNNH